MLVSEVPNSRNLVDRNINNLYQKENEKKSITILVAVYEQN